jgi:hypothetical protein
MRKYRKIYGLQKGCYVVEQYGIVYKNCGYLRPLIIIIIIIIIIIVVVVV